MKQPGRVLKQISALAAFLALAACKHTLEVQGQGDIVEMVNGVRGCSMEEFQAGLTRCTDNEITGDERAVYRALPRPGWRFSHWEAICEPESQDGDCEHNYEQRLVDIWDSEPRDPLPPIRAVFTQDGDTLQGSSYIASQFGGIGSTGYATLLDALLTADGDFRYTTQQAGTLNGFERRPTYYRVESNGQLVLRNSRGTLVSGGGVSTGADIVSVVDTDASDNNLSVAFLQAQREGAKLEHMSGEYFCGHISTRNFGRNAGYSRFFRAVLDGKGNGVLTVISDRWQQVGSAALAYQVFDDGTATIQYLGQQMTGSVSADGGIFTSSEISNNGRGAGICVRASGDKLVSSVAGDYYGAWVYIQSPLLTGVTELGVNQFGSAAERVVRDSVGDGNYFLDVGFVNVLLGGRLQTRYREGGISPDGRVLFLIETNPQALPNLALYIRKR